MKSHGTKENIIPIKDSKGQSLIHYTSWQE